MGDEVGAAPIIDEIAPIITEIADDLEPTEPVSTTQDGLQDYQLSELNESGQTTVNVDSQETVTFTDVTKKGMSSAIRTLKQPTLMPNMLDTAVTDYTKQQIIHFLRTATQIGGFTWTKDKPALSQYTHPGSQAPIDGASSPYLFSYDFPKSLIANRRAFHDKLQNFTMFRGDFVVRVIINKQPFQQGGLYAFALPYPSLMPYATDGRLNGTLTSVTSIPGRMWNIGETQVIEFRMPACGPKLFYDLVNDNFTWWSFHLACLVPLRDPMGTGTIEGTVYAYMDNVDLRLRTGASSKIQPSLLSAPEEGRVQTPTGSQAAHTRSFNRTAHVHGGTEAHAQSSGGSISGMTSSLANAARSFDFIPGAMEFAEPVATAMDAVGGIAKLFGFSKPSSTETYSRSVLHQTPSFLSVDGQFVGHSLASLEVNGLDPVRDFAASGEDELSILSIARRSAVLNVFQWKTSQTGGTQLYEYDVSPVQDWWNDDRSSVSFPPFTLAMSPFPLYNCDWEFNFESFDTKYQSGKLEIIYVPRYYANAIAPGTVDSTTCIKWIWDVKEKQKFKISVPFCSSEQWLQNPSHRARSRGDWRYQDVSSGTLYVRVLNTLTTSSSASDTIDIACIMMPAANLTVGGGLHPPYFSPAYQYAVIPPPSAEDGLDEVDLHAPQQQREAWQFAGGVIGQAMKASVQNTITHTTRNKSSTNCATTTGEVIVSMLPLTRRFHYVGRAINTLETTGHYFRVRPDNSCDYVSRSDASRVFPTWIEVLEACFAFRRGGMRVAAVLEQPIGALTDEYQFVRVTTQNDVLEDRRPSSENFEFLRGSVIEAFPISDEVSISDTGAIPIYKRNEGPIMVEVPYYSRYHCLLNEWTDPSTSLRAYVDDCVVPQNDLYLNPYLLSGRREEGFVPCTIQLYKAARDDFTLGLFMGVPVFVNMNRTLAEADSVMNKNN